MLTHQCGRLAQVQPHRSSVTVDSQFCFLRYLLVTTEACFLFFFVYLYSLSLTKCISNPNLTLDTRCELWSLIVNVLSFLNDLLDISCNTSHIWNEQNTDRDCVVVWFWGQAEFVKRNASAKWIEWLLLLWFEDQSPFISCSFVGDRLGQLRTDGPQMLHGRRSNPIGGAGPQHNGDWLVQALPYLLHGGPNDGAAHPPLLSDVPGEHHWALLWAILRLAPKYKVLLLRLRFHSRLNRILGQVFFYKSCSPAPGSARWWSPLEQIPVGISLKGPLTGPTTLGAEPLHSLETYCNSFDIL